MSGFVLSACSTVDLSPEWLHSRSVCIVNFNYCLNGEWHKDDFGQTITPHELYTRMLAGESATTSQVALGEYLDYFRGFMQQGKDVLHVTLSSGISSSYGSACLAAEQLSNEYPGRTIYVVDSLCASAGYGLLIDRLADLRDEGMELEELHTWAEEHKLEVNHLFFSSDLTFFVKGGRVSPIAGAVGGMLKICPLMHVATDGSLQVKEKIRTKHKTKLRTVKRMEELAEGGADYAQRVFISHADCLGDAQEVAQLVQQKFPHIRDNEVHIFDIGATMGAHTGPGTVALFYWGNPQRWIA